MYNSAAVIELEDETSSSKEGWVEQTWKKVLTANIRINMRHQKQPQEQFINIHYRDTRAKVNVLKLFYSVSSINC